MKSIPGAQRPRGKGKSMLLYEAMEELAIERTDNPRVILDVKNPVIADAFGHEYNGVKIRFGGINGRLNDIPAFLGGFELRMYKHNTENDTYYIEL